MRKKEPLDVIDKELSRYITKKGKTDGVLLKAIEAYEDAKWNEFDVNDKSTWPEDKMMVITNRGIANFKKIGETTVMWSIITNYPVSSSGYGQCGIEKWKSID